MANRAVANPTETKLRALLLEEFAANQSSRAWIARGGTGVKIRFNQFSLTPQMKAQTNEIGRRFGCHTCDTRLENDSDQPWVGDHFPPTELGLHARKALDIVFEGKYVNARTQVLRPQCNDCSYQQATLVRLLNTMTGSEIVKWLQGDEDERWRVLMLIQGAEPPEKGVNAIGSSGPTVSRTEGFQIQDLGRRNGCHSDPSHLAPASTYHADHTWPQEFCTSYMEAVLKHLNLLDGNRPADQELRPQCPRCSGNQGGKLRQIAAVAQQYADMHGITFYK